MICFFITYDSHDLHIKARHCHMQWRLRACVQHLIIFAQQISTTGIRIRFVTIQIRWSESSAPNEDLVGWHVKRTFHFFACPTAFTESSALPVLTTESLVRLICGRSKAG